MANWQVVLIGSLVLLGTGVLEDHFKEYFPSQKKTAYAANYSKSKSLVLGEAVSEDVVNAALSSENFRLEELTVGGGLAVEMQDDEEGVAIKLADLNSEIFMVKETDDIKALLSWKTNKATRSSVNYLKSGDSNSKEIKEGSYSFSHAMVIPILAPASVYTYTIKSVDRQGNEVMSDQYVFYSGASNVSLLDVLKDATDKVFGWAIKK